MLYAIPLLFVIVAFAPARADEPPKVVDLKKGVPFAGHTEATVVEIRPRVTGLLTKILVKEGEAVRKGDVLAEIDNRVFKTKLTVAQADLKVARAQEKAAAAELARVKAAVANSAAAKSDLDKAEANLEEAKARVEVAKAVVELSQINLAYTKLTAPIDGRVRLFHAVEGDVVTADKTRVTEVIRDNPISVVFDVDENAALAVNRAVKDGGKLVVEVGGNEEGYPHKGEVNAKAMVVNPKTGTVQLRATLENPKGALIHGQYVRVKLSVQPK